MEFNLRNCIVLQGLIEQQQRNVQCAVISKGKGPLKLHPSLPQYELMEEMWNTMTSEERKSLFTMIKKLRVRLSNKSDRLKRNRERSHQDHNFIRVKPHLLSLI